MADVAMPRLSDSMEEGTILKWLKSDGDTVRRGDELVEIETDKANMTYEADQEGTLSIVAQEGDTLAVGETIAEIGDAPAQQQPQAQPEQQQPQAEPAQEQAQAAPDQPQPEAAQQREPEPAPAATTEQPPEPEAAPAEQQPEAAPQAASSQPETPERPQPPAVSQPERPQPAPASNGQHDGERVKASPIARRMARDMGLELGGVEGSGPGGRIVKADVEAAAHHEGTEETAPAEAPQAAPAEEPQAAPAEAQPEPEPAPAREVPAPVASGDTAASGRGDVTAQDLNRLQQTIARRMAESKATAPDFVLNIDVDMEAAVELRKQLKAAAGDDGPAPSFNDFVIKAAALALRDFPRANGAYRDGRFELYSRVNVGVAVAAQDALVVPTVFDADRKSLGQIARESRALAERVRAGAITPPELSGGTFSVSNLGMYGIASFVPVINPPQAAILGVGAMEPTPVVVDGEVAVRTRMRLTLACDHRILYGAEAAEFLGRIRQRLEQPLTLAL
jgi:pyruvate dehydrogenase E2 component (dihydrolipoamide acetyltransferase)